MNTAYLPGRDAIRRNQPDEGFDVRELARQLWRQRLVLLATMLLAGVVALAAGLLTPRTYAATASLLLSRSKLGDSNTEALSVPNFLPLVENREVAAEVIKRFHLDALPYEASPTTFFDTLVTVEPVRNSSVIDITGRLRDPKLVADVVNAVALIGTETARRVSQDEAVQARNDIKAQLDEAKARLDVADSRLTAVKSSFQLELLKKDIDSALLTRGGLLELSIKIEAERARLAAAQKELASRHLADTVHKTIDTDPSLLEAARATQPSGSSVLGLQLKSEEINPVYQDIDKAVAESRAKLAGLERERAQIAARNLDGAQMAKLNDYYAKDIQVSRLELERDLAKKVYEEVATSYESARLLVAGRSSALHVISGAVPPDRAESRQLARNTLIGAMSGLLIAATVLILRYAFAADGSHGHGAHP